MLFGKKQRWQSWALQQWSFLLLSYASHTPSNSLQGALYMSCIFPFATPRYFPHPLTNCCPAAGVTGGCPGSAACRVRTAELGSLEKWWVLLVLPSVRIVVGVSPLSSPSPWSALQGIIRSETSICLCEIWLQWINEFKRKAVDTWTWGTHTCFFRKSD